MARRVLKDCTCGAETTRHDPKCDVAWEPNPGPQTKFVGSKAHEVLYGGAAGGGKSDAIVALPLQWIHIPHFGALVLRRTTPQLLDLKSKAARLFPRFGATSRTSGESVIWRFPSGATVWFNHCQHEEDAGNYDGHEFQLVEFDELPGFSQSQYMRIRERIRSSRPGLPSFTRSTANPPDRPEGLWVFSRFGAWLDPEAKITGLPERRDADGKRLPPADPGQVLWFLKSDDSNTEEVVPAGTYGALSRTFIPAKTSDNPHIQAEYLAVLNSMDPVRRAQMRDGNWLAKPSRGAYFKRGWFKIISTMPSDADIEARVRTWDLAATEAAQGKGKGRDPDWTVGERWAKTKDGRFICENVVRFRGRPLEVDQAIETTARADGRRVSVRLPEDPGQAGKALAEHHIRMLAGFNVHAKRVTGDKVTRAGPYSSQVEAGNVYLLEGAWNTPFIEEHEAFPEGGHDDQVDAGSDAIEELASETPFSHDLGPHAGFHPRFSSEQTAPPPNELQRPSSHSMDIDKIKRSGRW